MQLLLREVMRVYLDIFHWQNLGNLQKKIFYFLKANKKHSCVMKVLRKAINGGDGLGMKVPCRLLFFEDEKYINVLKEKLCMPL